jgi:hypothetical protein
MTERTRTLSWLWDLWLLIVFIGFAPVMVVINNPEAPRPWTALLIVLVAVGLAVVIRFALVSRGLDGRGVTYALALGGFLFLNTGLLLESLPRWAVLAIAVAAAAAAYRLRGLRLFEFLVSWACLALTIGPVVILVQNSLGDSDPVVIGENEQVPKFRSKPDVVIIVADGYASNDVLLEFYQYDNSSFADDLASLGMPMNPGMHSNYARTKFSVSSVFDLGYIPVGTPVTTAFESDLVATMGGQNRLTSVMASNGYRIVYLESGWLGTRCTQAIDVCVGGPWPDETYYDIVHRSVLRDLPGLESGIAFSRGGLHSLAELDAHLAGYLNDDVPDFIYAHLLVPHPPFFLDEECRMTPSPEMGGFAVAFPGQPETEAATRKEGYLRQVECANRHLIRAAETIADTDAVGLFFADHGPDFAAQLFTHAVQWSEAQKKERFEIMFAAHHLGCEYGSISSLVNTGRILLSCLSGAELPLLPNRYFDIDKRSAPPTILELDPPPGASQ